MKKWSSKLDLCVLWQKHKLYQMCEQDPFEVWASFGNDGANKHLQSFSNLSTIWSDMLLEYARWWTSQGTDTLGWRKALYIYGKHTISECTSRQWLSNFYKNMKGHRIWHHTLTQSKKSFQLLWVQFIWCRTWTPEERTWQIVIFIDQQVVLKKKSST